MRPTKHTLKECSFLVSIGEVVEPRRSYQSSTVRCGLKLHGKVLISSQLLLRRTGDCLHGGENLASAWHERDASIVAVSRPVLLLVQPYDGGLFPLHTPTVRPRPVVWRSQWRGTVLVYGGCHRALKPSLSGSAGSSSGPTPPRSGTLLMVPCTSKIEGTSSRGVHGGHISTSSTTFGSSAGDLVLSRALNHCTHRSRMSPMHVTRPNALCALGVFRAVYEFFPLKSIPLRCL